MKSFWTKLTKPFVVMAPMADVTCAAFRALVARRGAPDVYWTEFVSADGLYHTRLRMKDEKNKLLRDLQYGAEERPIVAQIFSSKPEMIAYGAKTAQEFGFDGVDINMGCPDRTIEKQGAGAALIKTAILATELIRAAKSATDLPVSVKTRVGYNEVALDEWLSRLLEANPSVLTVHLRTRKEMSLVPARWDLMPKIVEIRNRVNPRVLLIGNGDVQDRDDALLKIANSGSDGAMIGRGMFGNPWVFTGRKRENISIQEKLLALHELAQNFENLSPSKSFAILKKHIKAFVVGFDGADGLRAKLMETDSAAELESVISTFQFQNSV